MSTDQPFGAGTRASVAVSKIRDRRLVFGNPLTFRLWVHTRRHSLVVTTVIRIGCLRVAAWGFVGDWFDGSACNLLEQYANASALESNRFDRCRDGLGKFVEKDPFIRVYFFPINLLNFS